MGQQVCLINLCYAKQRVAVGVVSGFRGVDKFYFNIIPDACLKVDVKEVMCPTTTLTYPQSAANRYVLKDALGGNALWKEKYIRRA